MQIILKKMRRKQAQRINGTKQKTIGKTLDSKPTITVLNVAGLNIIV